MSNKSRTSGLVISLPQGGGALQEIGETFSTDLHMGTGILQYRLIALSPGRNGLQPQLSLVYGTGNSNGPFGLGWGLNVPVVKLKLLKELPKLKIKFYYPEWNNNFFSELNRRGML